VSLSAQGTHATRNLPCISSPATLAETLNATYANDSAQCPAAAASFPSVPTFVLYYNANSTLNASMIFFTGRATSYECVLRARI
jgi:hypothetical protein